MAWAVPDDNLPYLNTGTDLKFVLLHIFPTLDCQCLTHLPASEYSWDWFTYCEDRAPSQQIICISMRLPSKNPDCTTTIFERSKNFLVLLYVTSAWKIYQSTTVGRLRSNACQEFWFPPLFFEANPSSKLKALMRQVPKQKQVKLQCFSFYQIEKRPLGKNNYQHHLTILIAEEPTAERYTRLKL